MAASKEEQWASWKDKKEGKKAGKEGEVKDEPKGELLLLSEQVQSVFAKLDVKQRTISHKDRTWTFDAKFGLDERSFLAMLLSDVAGFRDPLVGKKDVCQAMCCAEFYAELFPVKLHRRLTERDLTERLTVALRRSAMTCRARSDARLAKIAHKIPLSPTETPITADPFTLQEIFLIINIVCEIPESRKTIIETRKRNFIILTISLCRQGNVNRQTIADKLKRIKDDFKIAELDFNLESILQLWAKYAKHVIVPPADVPMLDVKNEPKPNKEKKTKKKDEKNGKKENGDAKKDGESEDTEEAKDETSEAEASTTEDTTATEDDDVAELTEWMRDVEIDTKKNTWGSLFKRLARKSKQSLTLHHFVNNIHTTGSLTVTSNFRKAYQNFSEFDWMMAFNEFPQEQAKLWKTLDDLSKDPFCSYRKPDAVNHADFLHLGYLGVQLMEKAGGITSLSGYHGFVKYHAKMDRRHIVDRWVTIFCANYGYTDPKTISYKNHDPTLKYANFKIPGGKGTYDATAKYSNFRIPGGRGTNDTYNAHYGLHGCYGEGYGGDSYYGGYDEEFYSGGYDEGYHGGYGESSVSKQDEYTFASRDIRYYGSSQQQKGAGDGYHGNKQQQQQQKKGGSGGRQGNSSGGYHGNSSGGYQGNSSGGYQGNNSSGYQGNTAHGSGGWGSYGNQTRPGSGWGPAGKGRGRGLIDKIPGTQQNYGGYQGGYGGGPFSDSGIADVGPRGGPGCTAEEINYYRGLRDGFLIASGQSSGPGSSGPGAGRGWGNKS